MTSAFLARVSAAFLGLTGLPMLFASDVLLPWFVSGFPVGFSWVGQLLAAAWLSIALFNWSTRTAIVGGIYGRPSLNLNLLLYVVSALTMLKMGDASARTRIVAIPFALMAIAYGAVLLRGPFDALSGDA